MRQSSLWIIVFATSATLGAGGFFVGYYAGFSDSLGVLAPGESMSTAAVLRQLRKGDNESAMSMLESELDVQLMNRWKSDNLWKPYYRFFWNLDVERTLMAYSVEYRREFPSDVEDPWVRNALAETVERYGKQRAAD